MFTGQTLKSGSQDSPYSGGVLFSLYSNDAMCLDIVLDLELCTHDIQGVAVNFLITDRPEPVSFFVPEIARAFLKDKWKHDNRARR